MTEKETAVTDSKAEAQVRTIAAKVRPPFTHYTQKDDDGQPVETGELPRALALVADGTDPVDACEQIIDERVATSARAIRARDGDPYPRMDTYLPAGERRKRALDAIDGAPAEPASTRDAEDLARLRAEVEQRAKDDEAARAEAARVAAEKDAEIAALREQLDAATAPPAKEGKP